MAIYFQDDWFYEKDILIDLFCALVLFIILSYCIYRYRISNKQEKLKLLIFSFGALTLSYVLKAISHLIIYSVTTQQRQIGVITIVHKTVQSSPLPVFIGILGHRILFLLGLYFLYLVYVEKQSKMTLVFMIYLLLLVSYFSNTAFYIFHITAFLLLFFIGYTLFQRFTQEHYPRTKLLIISFGFLALSQPIFILIHFSNFYYVEAELIQLVGYVLLLYTFIQVLRHDKKAREKRHHH